MLRVGTTTFGYLYRTSVEAALESIAGAGYRLVEVAPSPPQIRLTDLEVAKRTELLRHFERLGLTCVSINPPELNLISPNPEIRELGLRHYRLAIDLAHELGAGIVVVVAGRQSPLIPMPKEDAIELALRQIDELARQARARSVKLAVETLPYGINETATAVSEFVARLDDEVVGIALDVANIFGREEIGAAVSVAGSRLLIAHLSDTSRERWAHTSLGNGEVDFRICIRALEQGNFDGPVIYELVDGEDPTPRIGLDLEKLKGWGLTA